ncbi:unnamed protein product [[Actinomadura] parvosata subsp. kistnae]|nr:unnamed protein product [Actinomadura parvosata subsp. kistnae]
MPHGVVQTAQGRGRLAERQPVRAEDRDHPGPAAGEQPAYGASARYTSAQVSRSPSSAASSARPASVDSRRKPGTEETGGNVR